MFTKGQSLSQLMPTGGYRIAQAFEKYLARMCTALGFRRKGEFTPGEVTKKDNWESKIREADLTNSYSNQRSARLFKTGSSWKSRHFQSVVSRSALEERSMSGANPSQICESLTSWVLLKFWIFLRALSNIWPRTASQTRLRDCWPKNHPKLR